MSAACSVKWCERSDGHSGLHSVHVAAVVTARAAVGLAVQSASDAGHNRKAVLSIGDGQVVEIVLTFSELEQFAHDALSAAKRYA